MELQEIKERMYSKKLYYCNDEILLQQPNLQKNISENTSISDNMSFHKSWFSPLFRITHYYLLINFQ